MKPVESSSGSSDLDSVIFPRTAFRARGFALIVTLSLMILLAILAVGLLSLSAVTLRSSGQGSAQAEARANARMALMFAIGELQKEMGPDMRVSAESALFDANADTGGIEGVQQSRWLGIYHSWGDWLNAEYQLPDGGETLAISDTYTPRRDRMFRRWLLSLPEGMESDINAPNSLAGWDDDNSVVLVGQGSLGTSAPDDQITRARLIPVGDGGNYAWWISPENHRAKVNLGQNGDSLSLHQLEVAHGNTPDVAVGLADGFDVLDQDEDAKIRIISNRTLEAAGVPREAAMGSFFDFSAHGQGVLASVRTGHLKKDLSLLFELGNDDLPAPYRFDSGAIREPSIRPMSPDLTAYNPRIPNRHLASWTNMHHFYRMYRNNGDATIGGTASGNPDAGSLQWDGQKPWTSFVASANVGTTSGWNGSNNYWRFPVLAKITFIYGLRATPVDPNADRNNPATQFRCFAVYSPVFVFWNPYNVELRIPDNQFHMMNEAFRVLPFRGEVYANNVRTNGVINGANLSTFNRLRSALRSDDGGDIIFRPGELRVFSHRQIISGQDGSLYPGFDPQAVGGQDRLIATFTRSQQPAVALRFSESVQHGNHQWGNTPGALCHTPDWAGTGGNRIPLMSQNDWFNVQQTRAPITIDPEPVNNVATRPQNLMPWDFESDVPVPVAYAQLSIKGISPIEYESIDWVRDWGGERDWRARNWLHAPPFYFGHAMYISEDDGIAHTQRLDNPYMMHFGPTSMAEMGKIIDHEGSTATLGSGGNPYEQVNAVAALELPTAPVTSLAGFAGMRVNPGWANFAQLNSPPLRVEGQGAIGMNTGNSSYFAAEVKATAYQSGVTGAGIGNSFIHPIIPGTEVYRFLNNSVSMDPRHRQQPFTNFNANDNKIFNDHWDHTFLVNDALWDDYFMSSLADEQRRGATSARPLATVIRDFANGGQIANSRLTARTEESPEAIISDLSDEEGYLKAAQHMMVDGMFNVNSTSVKAWYALFAGIRDRTPVFRNQNGVLGTITPPSGSRIAITRFNTEVTDQEMEDPGTGVNLGGNLRGWSGVRFLTDEHLTKLAEQCVRQVKLRGPFLNFSEFVNRRLSDDGLGLMGALQSAIDYDDASPDSASINHRFKSNSGFMMEIGEAGSTEHATPGALAGSRFAGIPGYVMQSDILKPIANTLSVRDDTFRIRAYGEALDAAGKVAARAWCEAIVQRVPDYCDPANAPSEPTLSIVTADGSLKETFAENGDITETNRRFGRKFQIVSFRWLNNREI